MKRIFTVLLVVVLLIGALSANTLSYAYALLQVVGDVNGDGRVNNRDLGSLQQYLNDWDVRIEGDADVNSDSRVNNRDMGELQQIVNGEPAEKRAIATKYTSLGAPAESYYPSNRLARVAWDMTIFDGRLYVGCGDFNRNSGDSPVLSCPLNDLGNWSTEAVVPDEQVGRFINFNGSLLIPGFDPIKRPELGYYYELKDGQWVTNEHLPYGLHNFDIAWFQGRLYAALGADRGEYPIAFTEDGVHYETIVMYKDGKPVDTSNSEVVRCSNLYVLGNDLYADFWYEDEISGRAVFEMYHYNIDEDRFDYIADLKTNTHGGLYSSAGLPLWEKAALGNTMFLTTGYLYYTTDFKTYTQLEMPNEAIVYDMMTFGSRLYILAAHQVGEEYRVTVYSTTAMNPASLRTEATYTYSLMPTAFVMDDNNFFIGMGNWYDRGSAGNGTILQIKR